LASTGFAFMRPDLTPSQAADGCGAPVPWDRD
jgi:hypothetical protein